MASSNIMYLHYTLYDIVILECENGTHKPGDKDHCIKCADNSYGKRCGHECNCLSNQM